MRGVAVRKVTLKQLALLIGLLAMLAVVAVYQLRPQLVAGVVASAGKTPQAGTYRVPTLGWDRAESRNLPAFAAGRNLFAFSAPPTPTPDRRPTPTPPPPPPPAPTPTPDGIYLADGRYFPPPPQFPLTYVGWLGPDHQPVAILRDGDEVLVTPVGEIVKGVFVIREVGPTALTIGFKDYPESVTRKVAITTK
jgi:hypothetical protein